jgi:hypothetical protein
VAASTTAPRFNSSVTTLTWPSLEARCKALSPFWNRVSIFHSDSAKSVILEPVSSDRQSHNRTLKDEEAEKNDKSDYQVWRRSFSTEITS